MCRARFCVCSKWLRDIVKVHFQHSFFSLLRHLIEFYCYENGRSTIKRNCVDKTWYGIPKIRTQLFIYVAFGFVLDLAGGGIMAKCLASCFSLLLLLLLYMGSWILDKYFQRVVVVAGYFRFVCNPYPRISYILMNRRIFSSFSLCMRETTYAS